MYVTGKRRRKVAELDDEDEEEETEAYIGTMEC